MSARSIVESIEPLARDTPVVLEARPKRSLVLSLGARTPRRADGAHAPPLPIAC
jgi:hypothetical protein